jgi:hypothetical protein
MLLDVNQSPPYLLTAAIGSNAHHLVPTALKFVRHIPD